MFKKCGAVSLLVKVTPGELCDGAITGIGGTSWGGCRRVVVAFVGHRVGAAARTVAAGGSVPFARFADLKATVEGRRQLDLSRREHGFEFKGRRHQQRASKSKPSCCSAKARCPSDCLALIATSFRESPWNN